VRTIHQLHVMTNLLKQAIEKTALLPAARQDELASMLLMAIESDRSEFALSAEQIAEVKARLASPDETVSLGQVKAELASWAK
jgi:hypothetical protein